VVLAKIAFRAELRVGQLMLLCFGFLNADDIGIDFFKPVKKTFSRGGANTVGVGRCEFLV